MAVREKLLSEEYRFNENAAPRNLTPRQIEARDMFLKEVLKKGVQGLLMKCPYCGAGNFTKISEIDARMLPSEIVICDSCDGCFKANVLDAEASRRHYEKVSYALRGKDDSGESMDELFSLRVKTYAYPRYFFISHFTNLISGKDLIAEFGCNDGANLLPWSRNGFDVFGMDLDPAPVEFGKKKGLNLICADLSKYEFLTKKPKLIILSHVLEHVADINDTLDRLIKILDPSGYIFVEVPGIRVWGAANPLVYFDTEHNYNFDLKSLKGLLEKHGFKILYGDEYIRLLCTPANNTAHAPRNPLRPSFGRARASILRNIIRLLEPKNKKLYDLLKKENSRSFRSRALNKFQDIYFKYYYSLFTGPKKDALNA